jgi:RES domain-containing protein
MSISLWRIAIQTPSQAASDLSGATAGVTGGRWNATGTPVVYCADSIALAQLEVMGHMRLASLTQQRFLVRVDIPDQVWSGREELNPPPEGWDANPAGAASIHAGEAWITGARSALLVVPSVIVPEEHNILLNPGHPEASAVCATVLRRWLPVHFPFESLMAGQEG